MVFSNDMIAELNLILKFPTNTLMQGLKIHQDATSETKFAIERLYAKGIVTQPDGGYLTDLGHDLSDIAQRLQLALSSKLN
ncbi:TIGR02647 family protein [Alteromonas sp. 5E99-2]|uniref:TIGR02647 family protein n=1 Tax=Alteromonas sp. 5E99-2 TaxID=2817683 RepID=UPI001A997A27|nr:TIGR02647 family protein [Alteromonas sp. 5E99-2]MBO1256923.1 TIGR02647 family protein [Alteromonas sp. 5E99-2]